MMISTSEYNYLINCNNNNSDYNDNNYTTTSSDNDNNLKITTIVDNTTTDNTTDHTTDQINNNLKIVTTSLINDNNPDDNKNSNNQINNNQINITTTTTLQIKSPISIEKLLENKNYSEISEIGRGAYGKVYKCKNNNEIVAIKIIEENIYCNVNDGLNEAGELMKLNHLNIIKVYKVFLLDNNCKILGIEMEYLKNDNLLNDIIKKNIKLSENLIYKFLQQACDALNYLKNKNIIHRDLNLKNIVVKHLDLQKEEIEIVIIDFGFVKSINSESSYSLKGTHGYLSPELLLNENNSLQYSFKSDIFALGVTIYRLMSFDLITDIGKLYHTLENDENLVKDKLINKINKNYNKYSDKLIHLILKMLERDINERYNVEQILNELNNKEDKQQLIQEEKEENKESEQQLMINKEMIDEVDNNNEMNQSIIVNSVIIDNNNNCDNIYSNNCDNNLQQSIETIIITNANNNNNLLETATTINNNLLETTTIMTNNNDNNHLMNNDNNILLNNYYSNNSNNRILTKTINKKKEEDLYFSRIMLCLCIVISGMLTKYLM